MKSFNDWWLNLKDEEKKEITSSPSKLVKSAFEAGYKLARPNAVVAFQDRESNDYFAHVFIGNSKDSINEIMTRKEYQQAKRLQVVFPPLIENIKIHDSNHRAQQWVDSLPVEKLLSNLPLDLAREAYSVGVSDKKPKAVVTYNDSSLSKDCAILLYGNKKACEDWIKDNHDLQMSNSLIVILKKENIQII